MYANEIYKNAIRRNVLTYTNGRLLETQKDLVDEAGYSLFVNGEYIDRMVCSPWDLREAVIGYLYMKEYMNDLKDIDQMEISEGKQEIRVQVSKSLIPDMSKPTENGECFTVKQIVGFSRKLEEKSGLFHRTGGVHCAALVRNGQFVSYREDVSRHMAVDKVVGNCLMEHISMKNAVLVFSGRVPAEILQKVAAMGCAMIIAKSAPTNYACDLAEELGVTLVGFARGNKFNVYAHPERICQ